MLNQTFKNTKISSIKTFWMYFSKSRDLELSCHFSWFNHKKEKKFKNKLYFLPSKETLIKFITLGQNACFYICYASQAKYFTDDTERHVIILILVLCLFFSLKCLFLFETTIVSKWNKILFNYKKIESNQNNGTFSQKMKLIVRLKTAS